MRCHWVSIHPQLNSIWPDQYNNRMALVGLVNANNKMPMVGRLSKTNTSAASVETNRMTRCMAWSSYWSTGKIQHNVDTACEDIDYYIGRYWSIPRWWMKMISDTESRYGLNTVEIRAVAATVWVVAADWRTTRPSWCQRVNTPIKADKVWQTTGDEEDDGIACIAGGNDGANAWYSQ